MHIHILGICGTFMGGIAALARQAGHKVTGCDSNVYPPMSTQLESQDIKLIEGYSPNQIELNPDIFLIGNVISRGNPLIEEILNRNLPYTSAPQWLSKNVLNDKWVLAVSGTHGKTTTSSMLAWILEYAGMEPGFLIGGIPENFNVSARLNNNSPFFVIEADEYDTAFFDKRSKFVHLRPKTAILNNLEFDHADIFSNLSSIIQQFHHFVRIIPANGLIITNGRENNLIQVLAKGCWTPVEKIGTSDGWEAKPSLNDSTEISFKGKSYGNLYWDLMGEHNQMNALAALAAAHHAGVKIKIGVKALTHFKNVKRRMELSGVVNGITVYDDFAHHPTSIQTTLDGLRSKVNNARIIAVLEPRSNTMKMGTWKENLAESVKNADLVFCYTYGLKWDIQKALKSKKSKAISSDNIDQLIQLITISSRPGDYILIMSNGDFGGIHKKLLESLNINHQSSI
tara:strand:- start:190 stop:1554 length:1365 start_codon:yes stop_codon:yes gene_type:complete